MKSDVSWKGALVWASLAILAMSIPGCGKSENVEARASSHHEIGEGITPAERPYFDAAKPFVEAIAARDYPKAYEYLSSHARAHASPNQFVAPDDDATTRRNELAAVRNLTAERFAQMLVPTEKEYGKPTKLLDLQVFSTDPVTLSGKGTSVENKLDSMFAIGMMPELVPSNIRKASLRSKLMVEPSPQQLAEAAKGQQTTPEKLKSDPDYQPYLNLKVVLVEEAGALKVGYFEFLPPGIMD
jgi:hypothetical protein